MKKQVKLSKVGTVTIPSRWRKLMGVQEGQWVNLYKKKNGFVIQKHEEETTYNTMVVGQSGKVRIPAEIKNELHLESDIIFEAAVINKKEIEYKIISKKNYNKLL